MHQGLVMTLTRSLRCHADRQQLPERWFPNRFDFVGASHQIFHLLVLGAGLVHYKALVCALNEARGPVDFCAAPIT